MQEILNRPPKPDRTWLDDYSSLNSATIMKHYSLSDIKALTPWSQPDYAGPLFQTVINGIFAMSGLCYGFGNPEKSFCRFLSANMNIKSPLSNVLYLMRESVAQNGLIWCDNIAIGTGGFQQGLFTIHRSSSAQSIIGLNVITLANRYMEALEELDTTKIDTKMPVCKTGDLVKQVIEYLEDNQDGSQL